MATLESPLCVFWRIRAEEVRETIRITVQTPVQLSNKGGLITLLDGAGLKVDGVAYTKEQANTEGRTNRF